VYSTVNQNGPAYKGPITTLYVHSTRQHMYTFVHGQEILPRGGAIASIGLRLRPCLQAQSKVEHADITCSSCPDFSQARGFLGCRQLHQIYLFVYVDLRIVLANLSLPQRSNQVPAFPAILHNVCVCVCAETVLCSSAQTEGRRVQGKLRTLPFVHMHLF